MLSPADKLFSVAGLIEAALTDGSKTPPRDQYSGHRRLYSWFARALKPDHLVVVGHRLSSVAASIAVDIKENGKGCISLIPSSGSRITRIKNLLIRNIRGCEELDRVIQKHFRLQQVEEIITQYNCPIENFIEEFKLRKLPRIDMAIMDGDRPSKMVRLDFVCILANSRKNTIIFLHKSSSAVRKFLCLTHPPRWLEEMQGEEPWFEAVKLPTHSSEILIRVLRN